MKLKEIEKERIATGQSKVKRISASSISPSSSFEISNKSLEKKDTEFVSKWVTIFSATLPEYEKNYKAIWRTQLVSILSRRDSYLSNQSINELYQFISKNKKTMIINETWETKELEGFGFKIKARGPDDKVFCKQPELLNKLPRGIVFVKENHQGINLAIFGNRKFFGRNPGDDDDCLICSSSLQTAVFHSFFITTKSNGDNCQIAGWKTKSGNFYWIIGSKNRKIAVQTPNQVNSTLFKSAAYSYSIKMANLFFQKYLSPMNEEKQQELKSFLITTRVTMNFEYESPQFQHVVPLHEEKLVFIGITGYHIEGAAAHPVLAAAIASYFGFPSVLEDWKEYHKSQLDEECDKIVHRWGIEGSVLVLLDDSNRVLDLIKVKTWWYVLLRAIREKVRRNSDVGAIRKRLNVLQSEMQMDPDFVSTFIILGEKFARWINSYPARKTLAQKEYPAAWSEFLKQNKLPSDKSLLTFKNMECTTNEPSEKEAKRLQKKLKKNENKAEEEDGYFDSGFSNSENSKKKKKKSKKKRK